jgi:hypothetical protein
MLGRFCSRDPIGYEGSTNGLYSYVNSSPLGKVDPTGLIEVIAVCSRFIGYDISPGTNAPIPKFEWQEFPHITGLGDSPCPPGWVFSRWKGIPDTPEKLIDKNLDRYPRCCECTCEKLKELLAHLKEKGADTTPVPWTWQADGPSWNKCERWCRGFEMQHSVGFPECVYEVSMHQTRWYGVGGHAVIRIVLCDGSVLFVDSGTIGGDDHVGVPGEVPWFIGREGPYWEVIVPNIPKWK